MSIRKGTHAKYKLITSLPQPVGSQLEISMDFVLGLPQTTRKRDSILAVVDCFSKMVPCSRTVDASRVADYSLRKLFAFRESQVLLYLIAMSTLWGYFWRSLWRKIGKELKYSSICHPQTDGQTEITSRSQGNMLRCIVGDQMKIWDEVLPQAEFAYNNLVNRTTRKTPFEAAHGFKPRYVLDLIPLP